MRTLAPTRALERRSRLYLDLAVIFVAAGIFAAAIGVAQYAIPLTSRSSDVYGIFNAFRVLTLIGGICLVIGGVLLAVRALTRKAENPLALQVAAALDASFDDHYAFISHIKIRGVGYIDAAIVGPPGVLLLRTLDWEGRFMNEGGRWLKANKRGAWKPIRTENPTRDVAQKVQKLRRAFARSELPEIPVFGVIVFVKDDPNAHLTLKDPVVAATHLASLYRRLQKNYLAKERIDPALAPQIVRLLLP